MEEFFKNDYYNKNIYISDIKVLINDIYYLSNNIKGNIRDMELEGADNIIISALNKVLDKIEIFNEDLFFFSFSRYYVNLEDSFSYIRDRLKCELKEKQELLLKLRHAHSPIFNILYKFSLNTDKTKLYILIIRNYNETVTDNKYFNNIMFYLINLDKLLSELDALVYSSFVTTE